MSPRVRRFPRFGIVVLAMFAAGCHQASVPGDTGAIADRTAAPTAHAPAAAQAIDADSPCRLLTDAEVRRVFPDAKTGAPERSREEYGIRACVWGTASGQLVLQQWKAEPNSVDNETRGLSEGFLDPLNPAARNNVRYETIAGVGEQAMAVIETQDKQRGILSDVAFLVTQHDDQLLELESSDLPRSERAIALRSLSSLARLAAARL